MANISRFNPISPLEDMFEQLTRGFFVRPVSFPPLRRTPSGRTRREKDDLQRARLRHDQPAAQPYAAEEERRRIDVS